MLTCYRTQRRVRAIRSGFDDRLLVFVDIEPLPLSMADAAKQLRAWRAAYDDELEIIAFIPLPQPDIAASDMRCRRSLTARMRALGLPVAGGVDESTDAGSCRSPSNPSLTTPHLEGWRCCDDDRHASLTRAALACVDLVLVHDIEAGAASFAASEVIGCIHVPSDRLEIEQGKLVAATADAIEFGNPHACGLVLRLPWCASNAEADTRHPLLSQLAAAVDRRRITCATRRFASLRGAL